MLKAADALGEAGYTVRLVSSRFMEWATKADVALGHTSLWVSQVVDYRRKGAFATYVKTGLSFHAARRLTKVLGVAHMPLHTLGAAYGRAFNDLLRIAKAEHADLFYAGTGGGLAVAALAARSAAVPYAVDLEDFHEGEDGPASDLSRQLIKRIQHEVLPRAAFVTAGSGPIAAQYEQEYGIPVLPIHNAFPLPAKAPDPEPPGNGALRLYWFSQTIGPRRGLEDVVRAIGRARIRVELHLRGYAIPEYVIGLERLAREEGADIILQVHDPAPPHQMVELSVPYDAGLSVEDGLCLNRELCLTNKALTYILSGLAVILTDTAGHNALAADLGPGALKYKVGDIDTLARGLRAWFDDRKQLRRAREAAWQAAKRRWNWDHPSEKTALLEAVRQCLKRACIDEHGYVQPGRF